MEEEIVPWCRVRGQGVPRGEGLVPRWRVVGKGRVSPLVVGDESPMVEGRGSCREYFWTGSMTGAVSRGLLIPFSLFKLWFRF